MSNGEATAGAGRYETARRFLDALFGQVESEAQAGLLVWTVRQGVKRSHWPGSVEAAARFAAGADEQTNVYVGCGWRYHALGPHARGARPEIAGIPALWVDMDVAGPGHGTKSYPPSFEEARQLVAALPLPPSIIVNSGGGLHLWWRLREPWAFENDSEQATAASLVADWEHTVQHYAGARGWVLDSVHDLPRVLRIPGTWRSKPDDPSPKFVDIESDNGLSYSPDDFTERMVIESRPRGTQVVGASIEIGMIVLRPDANPPQQKLTTLCAIEPRFEASWFHKRTDLRDDSESAYDLAVANYAAQADWTDQEIADLIIARRRNASADVAKALRLDYIRDRITHARASVSAARVAADVKVRADIQAVAEEQALIELDETVARGAGRTEVLAYVSEMFGVDVVRWTQATRHQPYYELHLRDGMVIAVGDVKNVTEQRRFANAVYAHTGRLLGPFSAANWARIVRALGSIVEISEAGSLSRLGQVIEWIDLYTADRAAALTDFDFTTLKRNEPFRKGGRLFVHLGAFWKWLQTKQQQKIPKTELLATMKLAGFAATHAGARDEGGQSCTRHYWAATEPLLSDAGLEARSVIAVSTEVTQ